MFRFLWFHSCRIIFNFLTNSDKFKNLLTVGYKPFSSAGRARGGLLAGQNSIFLTLFEKNSTSKYLLSINITLANKYNVVKTQLKLVCGFKF